MTGLALSRSLGFKNGQFEMTKTWYKTYWRKNNRKCFNKWCKEINLSEANITQNLKKNNDIKGTTIAMKILNSRSKLKASKTEELFGF